MVLHNFIKTDTAITFISHKYFYFVDDDDEGGRIPSPSILQCDDIPHLDPNDTRKSDLIERMLSAPPDLDLSSDESICLSSPGLRPLPETATR